MPSSSKYSADSILKLPEMEAIRRSAGMYIGNRQLYGLTHIAWEIVSNAIDEATAGYGRRIQVWLRANGSLSVIDQGRGIPVEYKPDEKMSALALAFLKLHAGGKFEGSNSAYGRSGGMHGTGGKACNAFSRWLEVEVRRHGLRFKIRFENGGKPVTGVEIYDADRHKLGEVDARTQLVLDKAGLASKVLVGGQPVAFRPYADPQTGTDVSFLPHRQFFDYDEMGWGKADAVPWDVDGERGLRERFRQAAYLVPDVAIELIDERGPEPKTETFKSADGLLGYLDWLNDGHAPLHKPLHFRDERAVTVSGHDTQVTTEVALQYAGEGTHIVSFVNTIPTPQGGKHVAAFQAALTKAVKGFADDKKLLRAGEELRADDVLLGLTAIVNVTMDGTPQFQGQTKDALNSPEVHGPVFSSTFDFLNNFLAKNIGTGKIIVNQAVASAHGRAAAQLARQAVMSRGSGGLDDAGAELTIKKLADIQRRGGRPVVPMEETELHLVEGDSAGGAAKQARDSARHGILALRGKIPNIFDLKLAKSLENVEIAAILRAMGGVEASGNSTIFNVEAMNFGRVCLLSVVGEEPVMLRDPAGKIQLVPIGAFVDDMLSKPAETLKDWNVASFSRDSRSTRFAPIKAVLRHPYSGSLYRVHTLHNRSITATGAHSLFVYERGEIQLKPTAEIRPGDFLVGPRRLPRSDVAKPDIPLISELRRRGKTATWWVRGEAVRRAAGTRAKQELINSALTQARVASRIEPTAFLNDTDLARLRSVRVAQGLTQKEMAAAMGLRQPISVSHFERGIQHPNRTAFEAYLRTVRIEAESLPSLRFRESRLDTWHASRSGANDHYREISDYKPLAWFTLDELAGLNGDTHLVVRAHHDEPIPSHVPVTWALAHFLGWYLAEGSLGGHCLVRLSLGKPDLEHYQFELESCVQAAFGQPAKFSYDKRNDTPTLYLHSPMARAIVQAVGLDVPAHAKSVPDEVFNWPADLQAAFLSGYFRGDGSVLNNRFGCATVSLTLAQSLRYLLLQFGVNARQSHADPHLNPKSAIQGRRRIYQLAVSGKANLLRAQPVWQGHKDAARLERYLSTPGQTKTHSQPISDDLMALKVVKVDELPADSLPVYDLSVERDENFICGEGGLCAHNTDADVDGEHIRVLLMLMLWKLRPELIRAGRLFVVRPPLYKIVPKKGEPRYAFSDAERDVIVRHFGGLERCEKVQRYKGLGEMNAAELQPLVFTPEARVNQVMVTMEDAEQAASTFELLMGAEVEPRRNWLMETWAQSA